MGKIKFNNNGSIYNYGTIKDSCIVSGSDNRVIIENKIHTSKKSKLPAYPLPDSPFIFISYAHKNSNQVLPIISKFKQNGYNIWYDNHIESGRKWEPSIETAIESSSIFLCFFSDDYWKSGPCRNEILFACQLSQFAMDGIIPVYLDNSIIPSGQGLKLQLSSRQGIPKAKWNSIEELYNLICTNRLIHKCHKET